ncbi:signal transduction histidine kinase [Candidatus Magnetomorum sp. HK-1]|nr:signal transduction histidine kinase [Candidatus Magnetomorum sp. HK-1]
MNKNFDLFTDTKQSSDASDDTLFFSNKEACQNTESNDLFINSEDTSIDPNEMIFAPEDKNKKPEITKIGWKILIVDDDKDVHTVTRIALNRFQFKEQSIQILSAFSASEAIEVLKEHPDIALILLDIVMESDNAGFDFLKYIRKELNNQHVRVIIRTGQPGQTPEIEVVRNYDVNDYKLKTDYTNEQLTTCIKTSLRVYSGIKELDKQKNKLETEVKKRSQELVSQSEKLKITKKKIETATKAKASFLSSMSHELRTPMNGIIGMAQLLYDTKLSKEQLGLTKDICQSGEQLLYVINNILDYSKLESNSLKLEEELFNIKDCIQEVVWKKEDEAHIKGLKIDYTIDRNVPEEFYGDYIRIQQILFHLFDNAIRFTNQGNVKLSLQTENIIEKNVVLKFSVTDTGVGINPEIKDAIFDRFLISHIQQSKSFGSRGLGLAICNKLVELMAGKIWIESTSDKGTDLSFTIQLKIHEQDQSEENIFLYQVLIISDLNIDQTITKFLVKKMGHKADCPLSNDNISEILNKKNYDIVFIDIVMPSKGDRLGIIQQIVNQTMDRKPRIIAMTSSITKEQREQYEQAGVDDFILKPLGQEKLVQVLKNKTSFFFKENNK